LSNIQAISMTMLIIVTFDLHGAPPSEYPRVKAALRRRRLEKQIRSKSGKLRALPANTFAAKFGGKWEGKAANQLRDHVRDEVRKIMKQLGLRATIFVAVGDGWAWGRRYIP
jgi:hypothetical protein